MTEETVLHGDTHRKITEICAVALAESSRTAPDLFDVIVGRLASAGIHVNEQETWKVRQHYPNIVAVVQVLPQEPDYLEYVALERLETDEFHIYYYDLPQGGDIAGWFGGLRSETEVTSLFDPPLNRAVLAGSRLIVRNGVKFYDEDELVKLHGMQRETRRVVTLKLPDEFLELCAEVRVEPAQVLRGFISDLCGLHSGDYSTNGSDESELANAYFERCGYRFMAKKN